jgi:hypothetical protein
MANLRGRFRVLRLMSLLLDLSLRGTTRQDNRQKKCVQ